MKIKIPIYIEQVIQEGQAAPIYSVRPLFFNEPAAHDEELQRATGKFVKAIKQEADAAGRQIRQTSLAGYAFSPEFESHFLRFQIYLKSRTATFNLLFVVFKKFDRSIAFSPSLPELWFELTSSGFIYTTAAEVLTAYFREREKGGRESAVNPEDVGVKGKAWASDVEIDINPPLLGASPKEDFRAMFGPDQGLDGEYELQQVGRCLDWLYPDDLRRVVEREVEIRELTRLLRSPDRRPVLLIGPSMTGKTALIEEYVYRAVSRHKSPFRSKRNVWLIAPQRLISGMSYVGQWENRLLSILKEAKERRHILYFDDLIGLLRAGVSRDSNLSVAQVMKPYIERREIRVLGEITPEGWRILRERDRAFADLFHPLPIEESGESETLSISLGLIRALESQHRCKFEIGVLPVALDLTRRYLRDSAFPGKAAWFLRQLAAKYPNQSIERDDAIQEFHGRSGLSHGFLSDLTTLNREDIIDSISQHVVDQPGAIAAAADAICIAKARLNSPDRPLASFLFLGPTGVGKTQCAKSIAAYLFGAEDRLIRFDMNEFISAGSVARLVGTFDQPEGLLTAAVRRQPFSVVLLDEIEKAHHDVFNLLLQVMSDGRLTDSLGRTANFSNVILIMTSNLGVKAAGSDLGFFPQRGNEDSVYLQAAEKFFSPEFFNRLDRIVPFQRLSREAVGKIVHNLIREVFAREGLVRRKVILNVERLAMEKIVDAGYHPQLGARALKRAIEKHLTQPLATHLATKPVTTFMVIDVFRAPQGANALRMAAQELRDAPPSEHLLIADLIEDPSGTAIKVESFLHRVEEEIDQIRPEGAISLDSISPEHRRYFTMNDLCRRLRKWQDSLSIRFRTSSALGAPGARSASGYYRLPRRFSASRIFYDRESGRSQLWKGLFAADDLDAFLREAAVPERKDEIGFRDELRDLLREIAWLSLLSQKPADDPPVQSLMLLRSLAGDPDQFLRSLRRSYCDLFASYFNLDVASSDIALSNGDGDYQWLSVRGQGAAPLSRIEAGVHLFLAAPERIEPFEIRMIQLRADEDPLQAGREYLRRREERIEALANDENLLQDVFDEYFNLPPVIRIYQKSGAGEELMFDLRSGLSSSSLFSVESLSVFLLSSIPLPPELRQ